MAKDKNQGNECAMRHGGHDKEVWKTLETFVVLGGNDHRDRNFTPGGMLELVTFFLMLNL